MGRPSTCLRVRAKSWHFRYCWQGKQKRISFGSYPEASLREACVLRDEARALLARGVNPLIERKRQRLAVQQAAENGFDWVFAQWHARRCLSLRHGRRTGLSQVELHPWQGWASCRSTMSVVITCAMRLARSNGVVPSAWRRRFAPGFGQMLRIQCAAISQKPTNRISSARVMAS
ncbi:Arm DNA-binding domain-containing protein [Nguyenibacter sp. L1]|uniref:Arm DNA-binding domain-containing protein n=1 Tax=Nguyenibacter sp. L1 TaxID=3049350 RepID=UPI0038D0C04D